jgi:Ni2+-binding GTPase involved in maturation of urease and hydrogenase
MKKVQLVFVGGFLGAGKTTLLWYAAELLMKRGTRVGLITNDQAPDLVDTRWLAEKGLNVKEVAGSCFCCNFAGLIYAAEKLLAADAEVLIGEPVGSCTDLSATILQPLKDRFKDRFALAPLSVLADPVRLRDVLGFSEDALHPDAAYIFRKQLEEADLLVVNKADLISSNERRQLEETLASRFPGTAVRYLSARTGEGIEPWLEEVLSGSPAGSHLVEVDYDTYAAGEALLGWLNADVGLSVIAGPVEWGVLCSDLLARLQATFRKRDARIGHVKLLLTAGDGHYIGNVTDARTAPFLEGQIVGTPSRADLTLNARIEMAPDALERVVREVLDAVLARRVRTEVRSMRCLRPGRPQPSYRYDRVVG